MKLNYFVLFTVIACISGNRSIAQVTADFSANKTSGCTPLTDVQFTDKSAPSDGVTYEWTLGNGNTSTVQNPVATYSTSGIYTVTLKATRNGQSSTKSMTIKVFKNPTANFTTTDGITKGCVPLTANFSDISLAGDTTIASWFWTYGTGAFSNLRQQPFTYYYEDTYPVSLAVTDNHGCTNTLTKDKFIDVAALPQVNFHANPAFTCKAPASIQFVNDTRVNKGTATYRWIVGSLVSDQKDATFTLNKYDTTYTIKLTVTNQDYGCSSDNQLDYRIDKIKASGTIKQGAKTIGTTGDVVCAGTIDFQNSSLPSTGLCLWDFGDNYSTYEPFGQHIYSKAGTYTVKLIASPGSYCADTTKWTFYVEKVVPEFTQTPDKSCQPSATVAFTNISSVNAASFTWKFGNGSTSSVKDPASQTYSVPSDADNYAIHDAVSFPTTLIASTINSCKDSVTHSFIIKRPTALFSVDTLSGCANLKVNFTDKSQSDSAIISRDWVFGDGVTSHKTTETTEQHIYTAAGIYNAKLTITNKNNCVDESYVIPIKVGTIPGAGFTVAPATVCQSDLVTITDNTPLADFWQYTINGLSIPFCSDVNSPSFKFKPDAGTLTIKQTVGYNGCYAQSTRTITNNGPIASFTYDIPTCNDPYSYQFTGTYKGTASAFKWLVDGTQVSTSQSPAYTFSSATENKDYTVKFIVIGPACSDTATQVVRVRKKIAIIAAPSLSWTCALQPVTFSASGSQPLSELCQDKYIWNFNDTTPIIRTDVDPVTHTFKYRGTYKVLLSAIHDNGCVDTISKSIRVYRPKAGLKTDKIGGCPGTQITFTDTSQPDVNPIVNLIMDYGNMVKESATSPGAVFKYVYIDQRVYSPYIKVIDDKGCYDSTFVSIGIEQPVVTLIPSVIPPQTCVGTTITFVQTALDMETMKWDFGDGVTSTSNLLSIDHVYTKEGDFTVKIKVSKYGCSDSTTLLVQTQKADASFTVSDSILYCPTKPITFTHTTPSKYIATGEWDTGETKFTYDTTQHTIAYYYKEPGTYTTQLSITTGFGCTDFKTKTIKILSPGAKFDISNHQACKKEPITFTMHDTINIGKYEWDFGDGNGDKTNLHPIVNHRYLLGGKRYVFLNINNPSGSCPKSISDSLTIDDVTAKFSVTDTAGCDDKTVLFTNLSTGNTSQVWNFSDGPVSTEINPEHSFVVGTYPVSLVVYSASTCSDTARKTMTVTHAPGITLSISSCANKKAQLHATGGNYINWWPKQGLSDSTSYDPVATPVGSVYYKAKVTNVTGGCSKTDSILIIRPRATVTPLNASIAIGDSVPISVTDTSSIQSYKWDPTTFLSCTKCLSPTAKPEESIAYYLILSEPSSCFTDTIRVSILLDYTNIGFHLPDAFRPGTDEVNSFFTIKGLGILEVLEFKIYNRWGNLVFSTTDKNKGWDGKYQGKDQPIDTYVWVATVRMGSETVKGGVIVKNKGTLLLLR